MSGEIEVSYTVKELLADLNRKIDGFMQLVAGKADQASVAHAHERIDRVEGDVREIKSTLTIKAQHRKWREEWRRWLVPTLLSLATLVVMAFQVFSS